MKHTISYDHHLGNIPLKISKITVIGGDKRFEMCAQLFASHGCECAVYAIDTNDTETISTKSATLKDALACSDALILPIPHTKNGTDLYSPLSEIKVPVNEILAELDEGCTVFTGDNKSLTNKEKAIRSFHIPHQNSLPFLEVYQLQNAPCQ